MFFFHVGFFLARLLAMLSDYCVLGLSVFFCCSGRIRVIFFFLRWLNNTGSSAYAVYVFFIDKLTTHVPCRETENNRNGYFSD